MPRNRYIGARMMLSNGRIFARLPMVGQEVATHTPTDFHPWLISRDLGMNPAGGQALDWWAKVKEHAMDLTVDVTWPAGGNYTATHNGVVLQRQMQGVMYGDERDRMNPTAYRWDGGHDDGPNTLIARMKLFSSLEPVVVEPYYLTLTHIAPSFFLQLTLLRDGGPSIEIQSWVTGGTSPVGSGGLEGLGFGTHVFDHPDYTVTDVNVTIARSVCYQHEGTWNAADGEYAPGVTTNRFED